jgi:hypothetical protein
MEGNMKYIVVTANGLEVAITFPEVITHADMAGRQSVVAAGFCNRDLEAFGESTSLGLKSRTQDTQLLKRDCHIFGAHI